MKCSVNACGCAEEAQCMVRAECWRAEVPFVQRTAFAVLQNNFRQQTIFEEFNRTKFPWIHVCILHVQGNKCLSGSLMPGVA